MPTEGCYGKKEWVDGEITDRCPVMFINDYSTGFEAYNWAEKGVMPSSGGWLDGQPAVLIEAISIISIEVAEHNKRESEFAKHQQ